MIEIIILGSGTVVPSLRRNSPGYCIKVNGEPLLFEMGAGMTWRLLRADLDYRNLHKLFVSHRHPDHCSDLISFFFAMNYTPGFRREAPFELYAPTGFKKIMKQLFEPFPWMEPKHFVLNVHEVEKTEIPGKNWTIRSMPTVHGDVPAVTYRLETEGKVIVYSGDSGYCDDLIENARNADLFIVECSYPENMELKGVHLNAREVAEVANRAKAKRLVLTHLYPHCDEQDIVAQIQKDFKGKVEKAEDLMRITLA